jgi:hypothetical protein
MFPIPARQGSLLDYEFDWASEAPGPWLAAGETIVSHTVTVTGPITSPSSELVGGRVKAWAAVAADVQPGQAAALVCAITTSLGRADSRRFDFVTAIK